MQIFPSYDNQGDGRRLQHFSVNTGFNVRLRKVEQAADFLSEVISAGANQVQFVRFDSTESRKHADRARILALQAAKEKAVATAQELGVQLGKPYRAVEGNTNDYWGYSLRSNSAVFAGNYSQPTEGIEPGQLKVSATFTVSYTMQ